MQIDVTILDYQHPQQSADLITLLNLYAQDPMGGGQPLTDYTQQNLASSLAATAHAFSIICYVDNKPAGLVNCFEAFSTFNCKPLVNIHDVIVLQEFRGLNVSQLMLDKVEAVARDKDCCKITLEVLEGNEVAKNAYLKFGFAGYELDPKMGKAMLWQKSLVK